MSNKFAYEAETFSHLTSQPQITDLLIVGGGINGCGIAADAAGRGLTVTLCEQDDLANATSSRSSKLIHGGLRYLEHFEFRLVRESLLEREVLLRKAPHIIWPLQFIMPHSQDLRPAWLIRLGLFLYDHLGGRQSLPKSQSINFKHHPAGNALNERFNKGFMYSDCWVDDARLVILNAMAAKETGATILTRTKLVETKRQSNHWEARLKNTITGEEQLIKAKVIINAAGPWVDDIIQNKLHISSKHHIALVKGSHLVVPQLYPDDFAFILQNTDKRIVFVIPYQNKYSLIGTTDVSYEGDPAAVKITPEEIDYLIKIANTYFQKTLSTQDIIWHYSGVRALKKDMSATPSAITRDYTLELNQDNNQAPLLNIFGGKITTYRKLAEHALEKLTEFFPHCTAAWTAHAKLPGGDIVNNDFNLFYQQFRQQYSWLPPTLSYRYARAYGTLANKLLNKASTLADLGKHYGHGLYEIEIDYLIKNEWALTVEDILWRRSKLGLAFTNEEVSLLKNDLSYYKK